MQVYLLRTPRQAQRDAVLNAPDLYFVIQEDSTGPSVREFDVVMTRTEVLKNLVDGQFADPVCILRGSLGEKLEDVSEDIAREVLDRIEDQDGLHDGFGYLIDNNFLDEAWPEWRSCVDPGVIDAPECEREDAA